MVILAGLEAFLGPLGTSLGRSWDFCLDFGGPRGVAHRFEERSGRAQAERRGTPPSQKLLANSDYTTAKLFTAK